MASDESRVDETPIRVRAASLFACGAVPAAVSHSSMMNVPHPARMTPLSARSNMDLGSMMLGFHRPMKPLSIKSKATLVATMSFVLLLVLISAVQMYFVKAEMKRVLEAQQFALVTRVADDIEQKLVHASR